MRARILAACFVLGCSQAPPPAPLAPSGPRDSTWAAIWPLEVGDVVRFALPTGAAASAVLRSAGRDSVQLIISGQRVQTVPLTSFRRVEREHVDFGTSWVRGQLVAAALGGMFAAIEGRSGHGPGPVEIAIGAVGLGVVLTVAWPARLWIPVRR